MSVYSQPRLQSWFTPLIVTFVVGGGVLFGLAWWSTESDATIAVTPKAMPVSASFLLELGKVDSTNTSTLAAAIVEKNLTESVDVPPSAEPTLVDARAQGSMEVTNNTNTVQALRDGARFRSENGVIVRTGRRIEIPAHGKVTVNVTADPLGLAGNLPPGRFVLSTLPVASQNSIYGQTSKALTGGQVEQKSGLTVDDLTKASNQTEEKIRASFGESEAGILRILIPKDVVTNPKASTTSATYRVSVTMVGRTIQFKPEDLDTFIQAELEKKVATGQRIISFDQPKVSVTSDPDSIRVEVEGTAALDSANPIFQTDQYAGKSRQEVIRTLTSHEEVVNVAISLKPVWRRSLPSQANRIHVSVNQPTP